MDEPTSDETYTIPMRFQTIGDDELGRDFVRRRARINIVGILFPIRACLEEPVLLDCDETAIGRDKTQDVLLADQSVSGRHARVLRRDGVFTIEDLESSNGTYVDNVPVITCTLHSGDTVQIGRSLFVFDRIRVFEDQTD